MQILARSHEHKISSRQPYRFRFSALQARQDRVRFECPGMLHPLPSQLLLKNFFARSLCYQIFLFNTNNLHTIVWFQVFLSNTNNLHTVVWFQVFLFNTNNLHTVVWFQVFLSNTNNCVVSNNFYLINNNNLFAHSFKYLKIILNK